MVERSRERALSEHGVEAEVDLVVLQQLQLLHQRRTLASAFVFSFAFRQIPLRTVLDKFF